MRLPSPFIRFGLSVRAYSGRERCTAKAGDECAPRGRYIQHRNRGARARQHRVVGEADTGRTGEHEEVQLA